ncbi:MAG: hypothetical protein CVU56_28180 [Deltaproteobacteria bacterium HGW-Deltaproteobacteria-14]|nr:MAG: hypothetical protein CVU56_28180 [Deltaproteobacteria bacterium HGW-Deltaproteobacteria-14]
MPRPARSPRGDHSVVTTIVVSSGSAVMSSSVKRMARQPSAPSIEEGQSPRDALVAVLVSDRGVRGDIDNYHAPSNSLISKVFERRRGQPVLVSAVWILVGRAADIDIVSGPDAGRWSCRTSQATPAASWWPAAAAATGARYSATRLAAAFQATNCSDRGHLAAKVVASSAAMGAMGRRCPAWTGTASPPRRAARAGPPRSRALRASAPTGSALMWTGSTDSRRPPTPIGGGRTRRPCPTVIPQWKRWGRRRRRLARRRRGRLLLCRGAAVCRRRWGEQLGAGQHRLRTGGA